MQRSLVKLEHLLVKYHSVMGDNSLTDGLRHAKLKKIRNKISGHTVKELKSVANSLSESGRYSMVFRLWCELINLTGDI